MARYMRVIPSRPPGPLLPGHLSRRARTAAGVLLLVYSIVFATWVQVPYILIQPGNADNVVGLMQVEGVPHYRPKGELLFLTVSLSDKITPLEAVGAWLDDAVDIVEERLFTGGQSREEVRRANLAEMQRSKDIAISVALQKLGHEVTVVDRGAAVLEVAADKPAHGLVEAGDVIVAVDGEPVTKAEQAIVAVQARRPGDLVRLSLDREGTTIEVPVTTVESDEGLPQVGLSLTDSVDIEFPFAVDIDTGRVGGPSAGLAFALAVIDELTPGELTGEKRVAVTGEITTDGSVRRVGGVAQKTVAARRAGAELMLVPVDEADEARSVAGDGIAVVGVANLDEALAALSELGGNVEEALRAR